MQRLSFHLNVKSPTKLIFSGPVLSVSSVNSSGPFDVLAHHANFISLVENQPITIRKADGSKLILNLTLAIFHVQSGTVNIYTEIAELEHVL